MDEIQNGIYVSDADGNVLGRSIAAGKIAVFQTITTRSCFLPIFPLVIPPILMKIVTGSGAIAAGSSPALILELVVITACMSVGLPAALALQPLKMELDVAGLEPEFQGLKTNAGNPIKQVFASKGM